ncbi:MAG TPA: hypothetical protein VFB45_15940 [Pseudolabrys sp.]|nr:hypothetical protein [Pseudolabrys sp.]
MIRGLTGVAVVAAATLLTGDVLAVGAGGAQWREVAWPFLMDEWGTGRAFQCAQPSCGKPVSLYVRAKVGFCGCSSGVENDDHVDRVSDVGLIDGNSVALAPGESVAVGPMKGRARPYRVERQGEPQDVALAVALSNNCDAVVATAVTSRKLEPEQERAVYAFLNSETFLDWADANSGYQYR